MDELRLATGRCSDCAVIPQALWYFADETIATPKPGIAAAGFARGTSAWEDLRQWASAHPLDAKLDAPPLLWIGAPDTLRRAELIDHGKTLVAGNTRWSFALVPKIPLNRSYYDASSTAFLSGRCLAIRGTACGGAFTARTIWPEEFRIDAGAPLEPIAPVAEAIRSLVRKDPH